MAEILSILAAGWDLIHLPLGGALCLAGGLLCVIGTIGVLRFPDFYTRLHAASITDTSGAALVLIGMACLAPDAIVLMKLFAIFVFLFLTSPTATHAVANAAHVAGLQPKIGAAARGRQTGEERS
jgi:multicomponent Na+:H+ antiporter subunit G